MDNLQHQARYFYESTEESSTEQTKQAWTIYNIKQLNTPQIHLKQAVQAQHHQQATGPNPRRCHTIHRKQVPTKRLTSASEKPYVCKKIRSWIFLQMDKGEQYNACRPNKHRNINQQRNKY
jgi:hypothetical protein